MNISDALNATPSPALLRTSANSGLPVKRSADQRPDGSDSVAKPSNAPDVPDRPAIRAHPMVSTEETLRRLPESVESGRYCSRMRKTGSEKDESEIQPSAGQAKRQRTPYDLPPVTQRDLDVLV